MTREALKGTEKVALQDGVALTQDDYASTPEQQQQQQSPLSVPKVKDLILVAVPGAYKRIKVRDLLHTGSMIHKGSLVFLSLWLEQYIWANACGVPIVHFKWVERCISEQCLLPKDDFLLPAGYSMKRDKFFYQSDLTRPPQAHLFSGI